MRTWIGRFHVCAAFASLLPLAASAAAGQPLPAPRPTVVGEVVQQAYANPRVAEPRKRATDLRLTWSQEIFSSGATYIAPHFAKFLLPPGASLVVKSPDGKDAWTYSGLGNGGLGNKGGFWALNIPGETAVVELWSRSSVRAGAVRIDSFARGFTAILPDDPLKTVCGTDQRLHAKCYKSSEPVIYSKSKAMVALLINGIGGCSGFLVGSNGHLLTNNHCISSQSTANNTTYRVMNEGACGEECNNDCSGSIVYTSATLVKTSSSLDYTLLRLSPPPSNNYIFFKMSTTPATVNQRIYIPQHPGAFAKKIAVTSTDPTDESGFCEVTTTSGGNCQGYTPNIGFRCDTSPGTSGSPVVAYSNHLVVGMETCGGCDQGFPYNFAKPISAIINDLGTDLPPNSTANSCLDVGQVCTYHADCCNNSCGMIKSLPPKCGLTPF